GGKLKPLKAAKKGPKDEDDEDDAAFKAKQKADAAKLKDLQARAAKGGPLGGSGCFSRMSESKRWDEWSSTDLGDCIELVAHVEKVAKESEVQDLNLVFGGWIAVNFWRAAILGAAEEDGDKAQVAWVKAATLDISSSNKREVKGPLQVEILGCEGLSEKRCEAILSRIFHMDSTSRYDKERITSDRQLDSCYPKVFDSSYLLAASLLKRLQLS
ncbi:hypothetical protein JCM5350_006975, partial [Sporobolomyces pararoseus]